MPEQQQPRPATGITVHDRSWKSDTRPFAKFTPYYVRNEMRLEPVCICYY